MHAYDLRRGCSLVEHLLGEGRVVYLVDYGTCTFADRRRGMEDWVDDVVPWAARGSGVHGSTSSPGRSAGSSRCSPWPPRRRRGTGCRSTPSPRSPARSTSPRCRSWRRCGPLAAARAARALGDLPGDRRFPGPLVSAAFQLTAVDRLVTKPLTLASRLDDRDFLAQIEAVDHLMANMRGYPGRVFGQIYHLMLRNNDLADGTLALRGRDIALVRGRRAGARRGGPRRRHRAARGRRAGDAAAHRRARGAFATAPGGHLGVLTGRRARDTTWLALDAFLADQRMTRASG